MFEATWRLALLRVVLDTVTMQLSEVLETVTRKTHGESIAIEELLRIFKRRSYGAGMLLLALVTLFPLTGAIPGFPAITGIAIMLLAGQLLFLRAHPWLPRRVARAALKRRVVERSIDRLQPWVKRFEPILKERFTALVDPPFVNVTAALCFALAALFIPFGFIPFAVAVPAATIAFLALGIVVRDGAVVMLGFLGAAASLWFALAVIQ